MEAVLEQGDYHRASSGTFKAVIYFARGVLLTRLRRLLSDQISLGFQRRLIKPRLRSVSKLPKSNVLINDAEVGNREGREQYVVHYYVPVIVQARGRKIAVKAVEELREGENRIFVEEDKNELGDADMVLTSLDKHQPSQIAEVGQCKIAALHGLKALLSVKSDADVSLLSLQSVCLP